MSTTTARRRRHSPAVYRRRRLVVLLVLLAIAATVWLLIAQPWTAWGSDPKAAASPDKTPDNTISELPVPADGTPSPTTESTPAAEPTTPSPAASEVVKPCVASDITVEALTDRTTYGAENPQLSIRLTNDGETDCTLNVGTSHQVFTIMSGSDVWWRSTDCQTEPSDMYVTLTAGQTVSSAAPLVWDRTRSSVKTCDATDRQRAPGGGASYYLSVEIGGITSDDATQFFLN